MQRKKFIVLGLGRYGLSAAVELERSGCEVIAVDQNIDLVNSLAEHVTLALCLDVTNEQAMKDVPFREVEGVIIAMGQNLDASIFATIWAKEHNVPLVICKALTEQQGKVLRKLGADRIIYPEIEMGRQLARDLAVSKMFDSIELGDNYSIVDFECPREWAGQSLRALNLREKYNANVIAIKENNRVHVNPDAKEPLPANSTLVLIAHNNTVEKLRVKYKIK